jgi:hypothetical protein|nr:MAG TPA: hypothetical protein [Caudoviricetes sp.]
MLYTVHTSFEARDNETGFMRRWSNTEKIEAPDKLAAKTIAWRHIAESGEYSFVTYGSQNARASSRK